MLGRDVQNHWLMVALDQYRRKELSRGEQKDPPMRRIKRYMLSYERITPLEARISILISTLQSRRTSWARKFRKIQG